MSNATFSRKPLVAAVLTTLAVFSTGAMAADGEQEVTLTVGTGANTVPNTIKDEKTWDEDWAKTFNKDFTNASGKVTINGQNSDKITISKDEANKTAGKLTNKLSSLTLNVGLDVAEGGTFVNNGTLEANKAITVTGSLVNTGTLKTNETLTIKGGFDNAKGKIEATKDVTINGLDKTTDLEAAPASGRHHAHERHPDEQRQGLQAQDRSREEGRRSRQDARESRPRDLRQGHAQ